MTTPRPFANSFAVVVGIDRYGNGIPELRTAANDARQVASTLAESHGYEVIQLIDAEASLERLTALLTKELPARVGPDDRVLFYWAGHGVALDGDTGPNGYLLPSDARRGEESTFLHMPLVHDALLALECRHMLVVLDSCFSGAFRWSGTRGVSLGNEVIHQEKYQRFVRDPAWQVITSASQDQKALDQLSAGALGSRDGDGAHSPFAVALLKALEGEADVMGEKGGDGLVTAHELYLYLDEHLQTAAIGAGTRQTPGLWPLRKHDKGEFVFFVPGRELDLPPAPELTFENNPWRGLSSYDAADKDLFFGRDTQIKALREHVETRPLTVVLGASGTGKSSLVKAGLVPRLSDDGWQVLPVMRPGTSPLKALAQAIDAPYAATATMLVPSATMTRALPAQAGTTSVMATRAAVEDGVRRRVRELLAEHPGHNVVLVIDQFEELITLSHRDADRDQVLALLASLVDEHGGALRLVITLRSDFEQNFEHTAFGDRWKSGGFLVAPMSEEDLREVIEKPAAKRVLYFDPSKLVNRLVTEVRESPGALPLLSFALSEMYITYVKRQGSDRAITEADYETLGGVAGALKSRAEAEYDQMDKAQRATLQHVMLRMVVAEAGGLVRRRVTDAELDFPDAAENVRRAEVVGRLTEARLLVKGKDPDGEAFVEPAHDALVRGWGRLKLWVRETGEAGRTSQDRAGWRRFFGGAGDAGFYSLEQRQRLTRAAGEWIGAGRKSRSGMVWSDPVRSAQLVPLVRARAPWLNQRELEFAKSSIRGRRVRRRLAIGAVSLITVLGVVALTFGIRATFQSAVATMRQLVAESANAMGDGGMDLAALLAVAASATPAPEARSPLLTWRLATANMRGYLHGNTGGVNSVALSPDGKTLASASDDGTVILWDVTSRQPDTLRGHTGAVMSVAFSPDGKYLASAGEDGTVIRWDPTSHKKIGEPLRTGSGTVLSIAFSPDGRTLAAGISNNTVILWDRGRGQRRPTRTRKDRGSAEEDSAFQRALRDTLEQQVETLRGHSGKVLGVMFSPDGHTLASASEDGTVRLWGIRRRPGHRVVRGETLWSISGPNPLRWPEIYRRSQPAPVYYPHWIWPGDVLDRGIEKPIGKRLPVGLGSHLGVAFSPNSRTLAVARGDDSVTLWDVTRQKRIAELRGHTGGAFSVAFSPDTTGTTKLATATAEGTVILWDVTPQKGVTHPKRIGEPLQGHTGAVMSLAFGRDGHTLVSASEDEKIILWGVAGLEPRSRLRAHTATVLSVAFSPDGKTLASASDDSTVILWDVTSHQPDTLRGHTGAVMSVAFSPNGKYLASAGEDGTVIRWDPTSHKKIGEPLRTGSDSVLSLAFSRDGKTLASANADGTIILWVDTLPGWKLSGKPLRGGRITSVAFSPDGKTLASANADGTIILWVDTLPRWAKSGKPLSGRGGRVTSVAFSPDGKTLASANADGTVITWDVATRHKRAPLRGHAGAVSSVVFSPDGQTLASASFDSTVILWDVANRRKRGAPLRGHTGAVMSVAFSPDSRTLAAASADSTVTLWDFTPDSLKRGACVTAARNLSVPEWQQSFGDPFSLRSEAVGDSTRRQRLAPSVDRASPCEGPPTYAPVSLGIWKRLVNALVWRCLQAPPRP